MPSRAWSPPISVGMLLGVLVVLVMGECTTHGQAVAGQILVKFRGGNAVGGPQLQGIRRMPAGARRVQALPLDGWQLIEVPAGLSTRRAVEWFRGDPDVLAVEPNHRYHAHRLPDDPEYGRLYGMERIGAPAAWDVTQGDEGVVVAVFDTGLNLLHPDLAPNLWKNPAEVAGNGVDDDGNGWVDDVHGVDVVEGDGDPSDDGGHGTHVAGTIGAVGGNGRGVAGVAWKARLMPIRVLSVDGSASTAEFVSAFDYATRQKRRGVDVRVINCSWGGDFPSLALKEAMEAAAAEGILLVCSAGNDHEDTDALPTFPAAYDIPGIVAVGASTACDDPSAFSNYGRVTVDLAAPGSGILSTFRGGERYGVLSGTSMAAPHVSGAAALLFGLLPNGTAAEIRALILGTVDPIAAWQGKSVTGGRLNVGRAVERAQGGTVPEPVPPAAGMGRIKAVSRTAEGRWAGGRSFQPSLSADGRWVAFVSAATNLVAGDKEGFLDIFLHDRNTDLIQRVSQTAAGVGGNGDSETPMVSADGRFVAYVSLASNLAGNDPNQTKDVFLWDRESRQTELISVRSDGRASGNGLSEVPAVNVDGSIVAFASDASDLVARDANEVRDVFIRDRSRRVTERMSVNSRGGEGFDWSDAPTLSADGRLVAFHSFAANLVDGDTNEKWDVFIRDRGAGRTELVGGAGIGKDDSIYPLLSGDGNWVAFSTAAEAFTGVPTGGRLLLAVYDRAGKRAMRAGYLAEGAEPAADVYAFGISSDGRFVSFTSDDPGLAPGGELAFYRAFLFDRLRDVHELIAVSDAGYPADDSSFYASISSDGRRVAFVSNAHGLVAGDGNAVADVFVLDRGEAIPDLGARVAGSAGSVAGNGIIHPLRTQRVAQSLASGESTAYEVSLANGGVARSFVVRANAGVTVRGWDFHAKAEVAGESADITTALAGAGWTTPTLPGGSNVVIQVTVSRTGEETSDAVFGPQIRVHATADGPALDAVSLVTSTTVSPPSSTLVSRAWDGTPAARTAEGVGLSADGNVVVFSSEADHLEGRSDLNLQSDVFRVDRAAGSIRRLSDASATVQGNADSRFPSVSTDGNRVAFQSRADNLVPSDSNGVEDIFVKDVVSGVTTRASVSASGVQGNRGSEGAFLAGGGRHVVFTSFASNLVSGDGNGSQDVFVRDLESGTTECVSRSGAGVWGDADSGGGWLSADGRFVVFHSFAGNLGPTDRNHVSDVYLRDRTTGMLELISANTNGVAANGNSGGGAISDDGRWVTFHSYANDLVPGILGIERHTYLLDRSTRTLRRVADVVGALPGGLEVRSAIVSSDGRWLGITGGGACETGGVVSQAFVFDRERSRVDPVSVTRGGDWGDDHSYPVRFSAGGRHLAYESFARNLLLETASPAGHVYVADLTRAGIDALVKGSGSWRGDGVATLQTPPAAVVLAPVSGEGGGAPFLLRVKNDGNTADRFRIRAESPAGSVVRVQREGMEPVIIGNGTGAGASPWETPSIPAGGTIDLAVTFSLPVGVAGDLNVAILVESIANSSQRDWIRVTAGLDSDHDGMPDSWETRFFGGLGIAGIGTDGDRDGALDSIEWLLNTDPTRPGDAVRLAIHGRESDGIVRLTWPTKAGTRYRVERSGRVDGGFVEVLGGSIVGTGSAMTWMDPSPSGEEPSYYRVQVEAP